MKKLICLLFIICALLSLLAVLFLIFYGNDFFAKQIKKFVENVTNREFYIDKVSFNYFTNFKMQEMKISNVPIFKNGSFGKINNISFDIDMAQLLKRNIKVNNLRIDGVELKLNYKNGRKFTIENYKKIKNNFFHKVAKVAFFKNAGFNSAVIENGKIDIELNFGKLQFKEIAVTLKEFDIYSDKLEGNANFVCNVLGFELPASFKFEYLPKNNSIKIDDVICGVLSLKGNGLIRFLPNGDTDTEFTIHAKMSRIQKFLFDILKLSPAVSLGDKNVVLTYKISGQKNFRTLNIQ